MFLVAPLFHANNFVTGLRKNKNFQLIIFQAVCLINNSSELSSKLHYIDKWLSTIEFSTDNKEKIIENLNLNQAH